MFQLPTLCIRFDINKVEQKLSAGAYGSACYKQVFKAIHPQTLEGCYLHMGDSGATLNGQENVCIIGLQSQNQEQLRYIQNILGADRVFLEVSAYNPLILSAGGSPEPLVYDGLFSRGGVQVEAGKSSWAKSAFDALMKERLAAQAQQQSVQSPVPPITQQQAQMPVQQPVQPIMQPPVQPPVQVPIQQLPVQPPVQPLVEEPAPIVDVTPGVPLPEEPPNVEPSVGEPADEIIKCFACGENIPDDSIFCPFCGNRLETNQAVSVPPPASAPPASAQYASAPPASAPAPVSQTGEPIPSLFQLKCPSCGSDRYQALGEKGAVGKSIGTALAFGAIGNMVASSRAAKNFETSPIEYKCASCNNKFISAPLSAQPDEMLAVPCTVTFQRLSSFVGAAISQMVYLNGVKVGPIKNGKSITFPTYIRYNTIYVADPYGVVFRDMHRFEAQPGGSVTVRFNRKFR